MVVAMQNTEEQLRKERAENQHILQELIVAKDQLRQSNLERDKTLKDLQQSR